MRHPTVSCSQLSSDKRRGHHDRHRHPGLFTMVVGAPGAALVRTGITGSRAFAPVLPALYSPPMRYRWVFVRRISESPTTAGEAMKPESNLFSASF